MVFRRYQSVFCSANKPAKPSSLAAQTPRSVIKPVTNRAGVTSKA